MKKENVYTEETRGRKKMRDGVRSKRKEEKRVAGWKTARRE